MGGLCWEVSTLLSAQMCLGAVKLEEQQGLLLLVLLLTLRFCPIGLMFLKIRKVWKETKCELASSSGNLKHWCLWKTKLRKVQGS